MISLQKFRLKLKKEEEEMELIFPAQPDLSLQISPPNSSTNSKPSSNGNWRRQPISSISPQHSLDFVFLNNKLPSPYSSSNFDPYLSNPNSSNFLHRYFPSGTAVSVPPNEGHSGLFHCHLQDLHHQGLGFLKPIKGVPVYQNPPSSSSIFGSGGGGSNGGRFNYNGLRPRFLASFQRRGTSEHRECCGQPPSMLVLFMLLNFWEAMKVSKSYTHISSLSSSL